MDKRSNFRLHEISNLENLNLNNFDDIRYSDKQNCEFMMIVFCFRSMNIASIGAFLFCQFRKLQKIYDCYVFNVGNKKKY